MATKAVREASDFPEINCFFGQKNTLGRDRDMDCDTSDYADLNDLKMISTFKFGEMTKVYCSCGRILDLDYSYLDRRITLGKELECVFCRNERISREIDELNALYSPEVEEESF